MNSLKITLVLLTFFLSFFCADAQNINFTIDTATASGPSITETITNNGNTYVLTATHSLNNGGASLFDNGGGDLLFFWQGGNANTSWNITITENGTPISFDLISFGFVSFGGVNTFDITNNDGDVISSNVNINSGQSGDFAIQNSSNTLDIGGFTITGTTASSLQFVDFHNIVITPGQTLSVDSQVLNNVKVFPIPAKDVVTISSANATEKNVQIFNITGQLVLKTITTEGQVDIKQLNSGLYLLKIQDGNAVKTLKLIVDKS